jgi:hypothetical protein
VLRERRRLNILKGEGMAFKEAIREVVNFLR